MNSHTSSWIGDRRGVAAVEFALVAPVLLALLGGAVDFGFMMSGKSELANGLAQGVQYAQLQGPGVSAATVKSVVQTGSSRSGVKTPVTVSVTGPACYCVSGQPAALSTTSTPLSAGNKCAGTCPGTATAPGAYLIIATSYVYQPLMPFYSNITSTTVAEAVTVRLQ
jgi:Flp pilus assembly protein TadG